jgi:hypothetical protein
MTDFYSIHRMRGTKVVGYSSHVEGFETQAGLRESRVVSVEGSFLCFGQYL